MKAHPLGNTFTVPDFINKVPKEHFAGISVPCSNGLREARNSAIADVVKQVLGAINTEYKHSYVNQVSGDPKNPNIFIKDTYTRVSSSDIALDTEQNIIQTIFKKDRFEKHICFILVRYPTEKIQNIKRLSKGGNIVASLISFNGGVLRIKITEANGVAVTVVSADISIRKKYKFSRFINFCIMKVPYESDNQFKTALDPIKICNETLTIRLNPYQLQKTWKDYCLGTKLNCHVKIHGFDELNRPVFTAIRF